MKRFVMLMAAVMALGACNLDGNSPVTGNSEPSDPAKETFDPALKIDISKMTKTAAGTYYRDETVGTGAALGSSEVAVISYLGLLKNGAPFQQQINQTVTMASLIGGLRDGMPGMKVGGERIIVVPSALGFGSFASGGVPANSTLIFDVKLISIP